MDANGLCLVVGGSGFLGLRLVNILIDAGVRVRILDLAAPEKISSLVEVVLGDMCDKAVLDRVHTVFHVASIVDLSPFLSPKMAEVNIEGTRKLVAASIENNVSFFVYTSSIDAVFSGKPIANGDESLPLLSDPTLCPYGYTKAQAEKIVLEADGQSNMRTTALRPGHIFGPGDFMIPQILTLSAQGQLPFRFGSGDNDYIYVDNCAVAHVQCWKGLVTSPTAVAGQAFFVSDYHCNVWRHMAVFLGCRQLSLPSLWVPLFPVYLMALVLYYVACTWRLLTGRVLSFVFTRYSVLAVGQDFYFCNERAAKAFKFKSVLPLHVGRMRTAEWVVTLPLPSSVPLQLVHVLHLVYGLLLSGAGLYQFLFPVSINRFLHMDTTPFPASGAVLSQTFGLIVGVLGLYSIVAALGRWTVTFFLVTCWAKIMTGAVFLFHVSSDHVPWQLGYAGLLEIAVGLLTLGLTMTKRVDLRVRFDRVTLAQSLHAIASGLFTAALMARPSAVLPLVVPGDSRIGNSPTALAWGYAMGTAEWMMTWTYTASAFLVAFQPFVGLSIVTRLLAVSALALSYCCGFSSGTQLSGVLPDGVLALISLWAVTTARRHGDRGDHHRKGT